MDCAGDADGFCLDHRKSLIGCYRGPGCNESSECLIRVFSSEIDKCRPKGLAVTETTRPRTSTSLSTYLMASESLITIGVPARATAAQRNRAKIAMKRRIHIADLYPRFRSASVRSH